MFFSANGDIINKHINKEGFINLNWFHSKDQKKEDINNLKNDLSNLTNDVSKLEDKILDHDEKILDYDEKFNSFEEIQYEMEKEINDNEVVLDEMRQHISGFVNNDGNIGIGINNPTEKLEVNGNIKANKINVNGDITIPQAYSSTNPENPDAGKSSKLLFYSNPGFGEAGINYVGGPKYKEQPESYLNLFTGGSTKMSIKQNGNVGIGTTTPTSKLDVNGNIKANEINVNGNIKANEINVNKNFNGVANGNYIGKISGIDSNINETGVRFVEKDGDDLRSNKTKVLNVLSNGTSKMVVTGKGNVGIGTTTPSEKLEVNGKICLINGEGRECLTKETLGKLVDLANK